MLRIDPPVDARYLHTTYLLDLVAAAGVRVVNRPAGIRALHEKLRRARSSPSCARATSVTSRSARGRGVRRRVRRRGGQAGRRVRRHGRVAARSDDPGCHALAESATGGGSRHVIVQEYLPAVAAGNKRLFLLDGEIIGAVLRRPCDDDFRIGPPVAAAEIDAADRRDRRRTRARCSCAHGIALAGARRDRRPLIEVNVTCPGGMHKTDALLGTDLSGAIDAPAAPRPADIQRKSLVMSTIPSSASP